MDFPLPLASENMFLFSLKPSLEVSSKSKSLLNVQDNLECLYYSPQNTSNFLTAWIQSQLHSFREQLLL